MAKSKDQILIENGFTKRNDVELQEYGINKDCFYREIGQYKLFINHDTNLIYIIVGNMLYAKIVFIDMMSEEYIMESVIEAVEKDYNNSVNA